eukprot:6195715-Pleurochrysis_carterae.AAC.6
MPEKFTGPSLTCIQCACDEMLSSTSRERYAQIYQANAWLMQKDSRCRKCNTAAGESRVCKQTLVCVTCDRLQQVQEDQETNAGQHHDDLDSRLKCHKPALHRSPRARAVKPTTGFQM